MDTFEKLMTTTIPLLNTIKKDTTPKIFMYFQGYIDSFEPIYEPLPMSPRLRITINMMEN